MGLIPRCLRLINKFLFNLGRCFQETPDLVIDTTDELIKHVHEVLYLDDFQQFHFELIKTQKQIQKTFRKT